MHDVPRQAIQSQGIAVRVVAAEPSPAQAYDPDLDRDVAIKVLHGSDQDTTARTRLLREARAMARLTHPNVVTVYEVGTERNRDYVVMELVDGQSLDHWLASKPAESDVLSALIAAGRGLVAAHAANIVHRDFKPHNVLRARAAPTDAAIAYSDWFSVSSRKVRPVIRPELGRAEVLDQEADVGDAAAADPVA